MVTNATGHTDGNEANSLEFGLAHRRWRLCHAETARMTITKNLDYSSKDRGQVKQKVTVLYI